MSSEDFHLKNVRLLRKKKGWSQERLAKESTVSYQTLIKIEQGRINNPKLETLVKLSKALNVSIDKLIGF